MKKRVITVVLIITLFMTVCSVSAFADGSLTNFSAVREYYDGQFSDVTATDWFSSSVGTTYRLGLMNGISANVFSAKGNVTIAETITLAVRLHAIYNTGHCDVTQGTPWYQGYVDYAMEQGIISKIYPDYNRAATRAEYATIVCNSLPDRALKPINEVDDGIIPDVPMTRSYAPAVYRLYRAGVLTGSDAKGTFNPDSNIQRSEVAAIIARMADESQRREITLTKQQTLDAVSIAEKCSPAVFYIEIYDSYGEAIQSGSGFFIDSSGIAVTNYHVIDGGASALIQLTDGQVKKVLGVYDYDEARDIALLKVEGSGFNILNIGREKVVAGQTVFAIGSPQGLENSISQGIVANPSRTVAGYDYIQFTAPISSGSSGGALINEKGEVIGISSASFSGDASSVAQNLNLAIPVSALDTLSWNEYAPLEDVTYSATGWVDVENARNIVVSVEDRIAVPVYYWSDGYITISYDYISDSKTYVDASWGEFEDGYIPLYIEGLSGGYAMIEIELYDEDETTFLDSTYLFIYVVDATVTVSDSAPELYYGNSVQLTFYVDVGVYEGDFYIHCQADDPDIVSFSWGDWGDMDIPMTLTGIGQGTTTLEISLYDENDYCLFWGTMPVTVR